MVWKQKYTVCIRVQRRDGGRGREAERERIQRVIEWLMEPVPGSDGGIWTEAGNIYIYFGY